MTNMKILGENIPLGNDYIEIDSSKIPERQPEGVFVYVWGAGF